MGRDKATLRPAPPGHCCPSWAERTAALLAVVADPVIELGPGHSGAVPVPDAAPGTGPLVALAGGIAALRRLGWDGPVLVVATDLPRLTAGALGWLAAHPADRSIVPTLDGRDQPLCARYLMADLALVPTLVAGGRRALRDLVAAIDPLRPGPEEWGGPAGDLAALRDVDTPADLEHLVPAIEPEPR